MRGVVAAYETSFTESDAGTEALVLKRTTGERERQQKVRGDGVDLARVPQA
jgi:hypothetical protein